MIKKKRYIRPDIFFEDIEVADLCDLSVMGPEQGWGDGSDTGRPAERMSINPFCLDEPEFEYSINSDED